MESLVLEYQAKWLQPKPADHPGHSTAYNHMKCAWKEAREEVLKEKMDSGYFIHQDGQAVAI